MTVCNRFAMSLSAVLGLCGSVVAHEHTPLDPGRTANREPDQTYNEDEERFVRTSPGRGEGRAGASPETEGREGETIAVRIRILDTSTGTPTFCRVNVIGADGSFYEPDDHPLAPWGSRRTYGGETHGPSRYYGWFFYSDGDFVVRVPPGSLRIEAWKGYEFRPVRHTVSVGTDSPTAFELTLERTVPMAQHGYFSGDLHIHMDRRSENDDERALDLMAAEDIQYGFLLCMNDPKSYHGEMHRQEWPQQRRLGAASTVIRDGHGIVSGQEYRSHTYGHICLLMQEELALSGTSVDPNNWPVFGHVAQKTRALGGFSFHAHGGYSQEIYADYVQQAADGVELLQMAHYRGIGLSGWYRMLNIGFRFPAVAGSDFPYGRTLGDCRTYVHATSRPDFEGWTRGAAAGRSFFTTGPLLLLDVDGRRPGDTIELERGRVGTHRVKVRVRMQCEVTSVSHLDVILNGRTVARSSIAGRQPTGEWHELTCELNVTEPGWIAARAHGLSATGRPDAEAHTNPVYVYLDGKKPFDHADADWLIKKLDGRIKTLEQRDFPEKARAREFFDTSRTLLVELREKNR